MIDQISRAAFADELNKIASSWGTVIREGMIGSPGQGALTRGLSVLGTGMQAKQGLQTTFAKEDPSGHRRSRLERGMRFGGEMLGGILASGLASRALGARSAARIQAGGKPLHWATNFAGNLGAGIAGSVAGNAIGATPFTLKRRFLSNRSQPMIPQQQPQDNPVPGGAHSPDAITGQAQAM